MDGFIAPCFLSYKVSPVFDCAGIGDFLAASAPGE